jgi:hypothetical protein
MKKVWIGFVLIFHYQVSLNAQHVKKAEIFAQTKAANDLSLQGHIEKNASKITEVYTDDAMILPPGLPAPIRDKKEIFKYYVNGFSSGTSLRITTDTLRYDVIDENHAIEVGIYTILYETNGAKDLSEIKGTMLIFWERQKGAWRIKADMWH